MSMEIFQRDSLPDQSSTLSQKIEVITEQAAPRFLLNSQIADGGYPEHMPTIEEIYAYRLNDEVWID